MKIKHLLLLLFSGLLAAFSVSAQDAENKKIYLSVGGGLDFPAGTSNTILESGDTYPIAFFKGFQIDIDGAYFFTPNYGAGLKFLFGKNGRETEDLRIMPGLLYDNKYPIIEHRKNIFDEKICFVGPAVFGRWNLGTSRWSTQASLGIGYVSDKLYHLLTERYYTVRIVDGIGVSVIDSSLLPKDIGKAWADLSGNTLGFSASAGIHFRITSTIGVGISADGLVASLSKMKYEGIDGSGTHTDNISRKINRIGVFAGLDFNF